MLLVDIFVTLYFALFGMVQLHIWPEVKGGPWWSKYLIEGYFGAYMLVTCKILSKMLLAK